MRRLRLPPPFIRLVIDSLSDLTSCIRTIYGMTRRFTVERSLRQGDPLAPLLFIVLMDALHDGLETNPFTGRHHGCRLTHSAGSHSIASVGYADDTGIIVNSLADLAVQNDWVQYFMCFSLLRLNPLKCELVGRSAGGHAVTPAELARHNILIDGIAPVPVDHTRPIRYLGVHSCFNGDWSAQQAKAIKMIALYTRCAVKFKLPVKDAVYMFNTFLITKLELSFHYIHGPGTSRWLQQCDSLLFAAIRHLVKSPLKLSHSALSLLLGLHLPSRMEQVVKVSELFLRLNSGDAGWGGLGRATMRDQLPSSLSGDVALPHASRGSRLAVDWAEPLPCWLRSCSGQPTCANIQMLDDSCTCSLNHPARSDSRWPALLPPLYTSRRVRHEWHTTAGRAGVPRSTDWSILFTSTRTAHSTRGRVSRPGRS